MEERKPQSDEKIKAVGAEGSSDTSKKRAIPKLLLPPRPQRLEHLAEDTRGFPIFHTVKVENGKPDFKDPNVDGRNECVNNRRCGICGDALGNDIVCIGEDSEETRSKLQFGETAMHAECAKYASEVCPWLLNPGARMSLYRQLDPHTKLENIAKLVSVRPERMGRFYLENYRPLQVRGYNSVLVEGTKLLKVEPF